MYALCGLTAKNCNVESSSSIVIENAYDELDGGAFYVSGSEQTSGSMSYKSATIEDCNFKNNQCIDYGGSICVNKCTSLTVSACYFYNSTAHTLNSVSVANGHGCGGAI